MLKRTEIDKKYKWDLSAIYANEDAFHADFAKAEELIATFSENEKKMTEDADSFLQALEQYTKIDAIIEKLWQYAFLGYSLDTSDNKFQSLQSKVRSLNSSAAEATWFVSPYILKLDKALIEKWFSECEKLGIYRRMVDKILRSKPYTLSDENEQLISKMQDCFGTHSQIRSVFSNSDIRFGKIRDEEGGVLEITDANYVTTLMSQDRRVRRAAFKTIYKTYDAFKNTYAALFNSKIKETTTLASVRGFESSLSSSTFSDELTPEIYNNLIKAATVGLPTLYKYYALKKKVLGVKSLHMYDLYPPLIDSVDRKYTYDEAIEEVLCAVEVFGDEYCNALKDGLLNKCWADVYPTRGKRSGAFSSGSSFTEPYILLNYNDTFDDVSTLAHEAGHSMHTWFSTKYNEPHNSSYTLFVAEVASTVNELLLAHRKLNHSKSREEKLYILNNIMETYKATLFRQAMFAEFERDMHALSEAGEPLTADLISEKYYALVCRYFGDGVVCDKEIAYEWMRVPHFYTSFYVYKYATSISAASAIVKRIESEGAPYVEKYIEFLKCGDSKSPIDSLLVAEIDMNDPEIVNGAIEDFSNCIKMFEKLYYEK